LASARFWLIITKVERKIASSETIIVRRPKLGRLHHIVTPVAFRVPVGSIFDRGERWQAPARQGRHRRGAFKVTADL
jgi:hypothetical protein